MIALRKCDSQKDILPLPRKPYASAPSAMSPFATVIVFAKTKKTGVTDGAPHLYHFVC